MSGSDNSLQRNGRNVRTSGWSRSIHAEIAPRLKPTLHINEIEQRDRQDMIAYLMSPPDRTCGCCRPNVDIDSSLENMSRLTFEGTWISRRARN